MADELINLGGKSYDSLTGELIKDPKNPKTAQNYRAKPVATTLNRQYVNKPNLSTKPKFVDGFAKSKPQISSFRRQKPTLLEVAKVPAQTISHFNVGDFNPTDKPVIAGHRKNQNVEISPEQHEKFLKALAQARQTSLYSRHIANQVTRSRAKRSNEIFKTSKKIASKLVSTQTSNSSTKPESVNKSSSLTKHMAINQALSAAPSSNELEKSVKRDRFLSTLKPTKSLLIAAAIVLLIFGYIIYLNLPNITLELANRQANIKGAFPAYRPDGFQLEKYPESKTCGSSKCVEMWFVNSDSQTIKLTQAKSNWDSQAVLENNIKPLVGDNYTIYQEQGLTIFSYDNNKTSWVNGGVLYKIESSSSIASEQLRRIATSL